MKDLVTADELTCPKCKLVGCDCQPRPQSLPTHADVCSVCRRANALCICVSHVELARVAEAEGEPLPVTEKLSPQQIEAWINRVMKLYYDRDPAGIKKLLRQLLK
jgi:hypothetical protein